MSNHIDVIWQVQANHQPKDGQLSFMKFTAQMIIKDLRNNHKEVLETFKVKTSDRTYLPIPIGMGKKCFKHFITQSSFLQTKAQLHS